MVRSEEHVQENANETGGSHCLVAGAKGIRTRGPLLAFFAFEKELKPHPLRLEFADRSLVRTSLPSA